MHAFRLTFLETSGQLCLADDLNLTPKAIAKGDVSIESEVANLPEVLAIQPHHVVLDVGAFVGDTAITFAQRAGVVMAFEPQTDAWLCATWNTRLLPNVTTYNAAVGDGREAFPVSEALCGNLGTRGIHLGGEKKTLRLDDLPMRRLDFLKIDVEGFEPAVIAGAVGHIKQHLPIILVEIYHEMLARYGYTARDVIDPLTALGYQYRVAIGREDEPRYDLIFFIP